MGSAARRIVTRLLDFPMALEAMYQGEAVRRQAWGLNGGRIWHSDGVIVFANDGFIGPWEGMAYTDLLADDWVIDE